MSTRWLLKCTLVSHIVINCYLNKKSIYLFEYPYDSRTRCHRTKWYQCSLPLSVIKILCGQDRLAAAEILDEEAGNTLDNVPIVVSTNLRKEFRFCPPPQICNRHPIFPPLLIITKTSKEMMQIKKIERRRLKMVEKRGNRPSLFLFTYKKKGGGGE